MEVVSQKETQTQLENEKNAKKNATTAVCKRPKSLKVCLKVAEVALFVYVLEQLLFPHGQSLHFGLIKTSLCLFFSHKICIFFMIKNRNNSQIKKNWILCITCE